MSGSKTRGGTRQGKFTCDPEYVAHVVNNNPERLNPPAPDTTGNPLIDPLTGKRYDGAPS